VDIYIRKYTALEGTVRCIADVLCNAVPGDGATVMKHVACILQCECPHGQAVEWLKILALKQYSYNKTHKYTSKLETQNTKCHYICTL